MKRLIAASLLAALALPAAAQAETPNASEACKAQKASMGPAAFKALYGTNKNKSNAFGKCVSKQQAATQKATSTATANASKACRAEQADPNFASTHGGKTFDQFYGTNKNGKNSFGKCVSGKAKAAAAAAIAARQKTIINAAKTCKAERTAMGATAFNAKYGSNKSESNAFGRCVSKAAQAKS